MNLAIEEGRLRLVLLEMERHLLPGWHLEGAVDADTDSYVVWLTSAIARVPSRDADGRPRIVDVCYCAMDVGTLPFHPEVRNAEYLWRALCPGAFDPQPHEDEDDEDDS